MKHAKKIGAFLAIVLCAFVVGVSLLGRDKDCQVDLVVFSYNRPLQLEALLKSAQSYLTGLGTTIIIYRSGDQAFHDAYEKVHEAYPWAHFWEQGSNPQLDFKPLTMRALYQTSSSYIMFAVDDIVVKDYVDCAQCVRALERTGAYGFYLRLGAHLTYCYSCSAKQPLPMLDAIGDDVLSWTLGRASYDWGYPNTVDMTVYRKVDVVKDFSSFPFTNPNLLEGVWASFAGRVAQRKGLCFSETKIVNLPLNRVQTTYNNRTMESFTPQELLAFFNQGLTMDIKPLYQVKNSGAHMEYVPTFISRQKEGRS